MVQIIPANPRRNSFGEAFGKGLASALNAGIQTYEQRQKQKRYGEALRGVEDIYADPELSQEQKFIKSFSALREFPEAAKQFSSGLSQYQETPLQIAQRRKLENELEEMEGEQSYLQRLKGGGQEDIGQFEESEETPYRMGLEAEGRTEKTVQKKTTNKPKFSFEDPSTWSNKQVENFRSYEGKTAKGKSLAKRAQNEYARREESKKATTKYQENIAPLEGALEILDQMENLGKGGRLGIGTSVRGIFSPKTRRAAGEYERLGKSLISYSTNIPIRNRQEFEALAHDLYDPSISDDKREGILAAMKRIIQNSMKSYAPPEGQEERPQGRKTVQAQKEKPPLTSFLR